MGHWVRMGVGCPCPPIHNNIVTPRHCFFCMRAFFVDFFPIYSINFFFNRFEKREIKRAQRVRTTKLQTRKNRYIHTHKHTHTLTYTHTHTLTHKHARVSTHACTDTRAHRHRHTHTHTYTRKQDGNGALETMARFPFFYLDRSWRHLGSILEALGGSWRFLEALGSILEALGGILEASWRLLEPSWRLLRPQNLGNIELLKLS